MPAGNRRLAVIDTYFPWKQSGFRYWENHEIFHQRPDTLFFTVVPNHDYFPAPVYNFSQFASMALLHGITDIYAVFLNLALSLIGRTKLPNGMPVPGSNDNLSLWPFIQSQGIQTHTTLYPGGGLAPQTPLESLQIDKYYSTIFSNIHEVLLHYPGSIYVPGMINTDYYSYTPKQDVRPIQMVFSAHQGIRKNFAYVAQTFNQLDDSFHLHIIGNWEDHLPLITNPNFTFHGLLDPEPLRMIYRQSHVFISCSGKDHESFDGFPTTAAGDAMSTGCVLVTTNPRNDRYVLVSGEDYIELTDGISLIGILHWIKNNFQSAMQIGIRGSNKIAQNYDSKLVVRTKLAAMGLL